jgi:very-short-patch-repair endonuclease
MSLGDWCLHMLQKPYISLQHLITSEYHEEIHQWQQKLGGCITNPRQILWHINQDTDQIPHCPCGNTVSWHPDQRKYRQYCSKKCTGKYTAALAQETCRQKYGVDHYSQTQEYCQKVKATSQDKFQADHYSKTAEFATRVKQTNLKNLGVEFPIQNSQVREKTQRTNNQRWGSDSPLQSPLVKEKIAKTNLSRWGVGNPLANQDVKNKVKQTTLSRYGCENPMQSEDIKKKSQQTRQINHYSPEALTKIHNPKWLQEQNAQGKSLGQIAQDLGTSGGNVSQLFRRYNLTVHRHFSSALEADIADYFSQQNITVQIGNRKIIAPWEIDIWFPEHNLGVEINGAYWHKESQGKHRGYHLQKTQQAEQKGIQLLQFFDWEIQNNKKVVLDKICHELKLHKSLGARTLKIANLSSQQAVDFFQQNHLQGSCMSRIKLGLCDSQGEIFAAMTFGASRYSKKYNWELLRFACKQGYSVAGAASKLLKYFVKNHCQNGETIVSYCNRRWSQGRLYHQLGFHLESVSPPSYYYVTANGEYAGTRQAWQKHKLALKLDRYNPQLTEHENMAAHGFDKVWDCGQLVFTYSGIAVT